MKIKQILATTGLAALLSIGAGVGIAANKGASSVKAATSETTFYVDVRNSIWGSNNINQVKAHYWGGESGDVYIYQGGPNWSKFTYEGVTYVKYSISSFADSTGFQIYCWDLSKDGNITVDINPADFTEGQNLIVVGSSGSWDSKHPVTLGTLELPSTYEVTKVAVPSDADPYELGSDTVAAGEAYAAPFAPTVKGYRFEGWFSDADCSTVWDDTTVINADTSIYAKLTTIEVDSFVYWIDKDSTALTNVYFWGEYEPVAWPGTALSKYLVSDVLYYAGEGKLYRIPVPSAGDYKMILNGTEYDVEAKTDNITVTPFSLIYTWFDHQDSSRIYNFSVVDGTAAGFVAEVEKLRNRVEADPSKNILQYSICGVDPLDAQGFYNMYYEFPENVKESIDKSYTYTYEGSYDGTNVPSETNITFDKIMLALKTIAENNHLAVKGSSLFFMIEAQESNNMIMIIVISASATMLFATALLIIKKRKSHK